MLATAVERITEVFTAPSSSEPLNAQLRAELDNKTLGAFLSESAKPQEMEGISPAQPGLLNRVYTIDSRATVEEAMDMLARKKISSVPVLSTQPLVVYGFFDVAAAMESFLRGDWASWVQHHDQHAAHPETPVQAGAGEPTTMLSLLEKLNSFGPKFAKTRLTEITPSTDGELLYVGGLNSSLLEITQSGFLRMGLVGREGRSPHDHGPTPGAVHRIAIFQFDETRPDSDRKPAAVEIVAVVSQTDVLRWLHRRFAEDPSILLQRCRLDCPALRICPKRVQCVSADEPALAAYARLLRAGLPAAGVVAESAAELRAAERAERGPDGAGGGPCVPFKLVGSLALSDLKGIEAGAIGVLALPVGEFLAVRHATVWGSVPHGHPSPRARPGSAGAAERRDSLMQRSTLVALPPGASLGAAVAAMAGPQKARCVFITDPATGAALSVVTPTDVLRVLVELGGATVADAVLAEEGEEGAQKKKEAAAA